MFEYTPLSRKGQLSGVTASANPSGLLIRTNLTCRTVKLASADTTEWKRVLQEGACRWKNEVFRGAK